MLSTLPTSNSNNSNSNTDHGGIVRSNTGAIVHHPSIYRPKSRPQSITHSDSINSMNGITPEFGSIALPDVHDSGGTKGSTAPSKGLSMKHIINLRLKASSLRKKANENLFTKKLDPTSGQYYYIATATGETTWDVPRGNIKMISLDPEVLYKLSLGKNEKDEKKKMLKDERTMLIKLRLEENKALISKDDQKGEETEVKRQEHIWSEAIEHGKSHFSINLSWTKLGYISPLVFEFKSYAGTELLHLRLIGHELKSLPPQLGAACTRLISLSLTSNDLTDVECIVTLTHLTSLVLLRNKLTSLPDKIGNLVNLEILELASNKLVSLPATFGNLIKLRRLNLECNKLKRIPETLSRMTITVLNLNSNELTSLPHCISVMPNLVNLYANGNHIKYLPVDVGSSTTLECIHLCNNRIIELPDSISKLLPLRSLWLDYNNITALPMGFHNLLKLTELKMEGNFGMVFPTMDRIIRGVNAVRAWSRNRFTTSVYARQQSLVINYQDCLKQVLKHEVCQDDDDFKSMFETNVEHNGELYYQFPEEFFWAKFIPDLEVIWADATMNKLTSGDIKSYPYSVDETKEVMETFQDPYGPIIHRTETAWFKRCGCKKENGERIVCIPPKIGWMCERPAVLVKITMTLERELEARLITKRNKLAVKAASHAAGKLAGEYLDSDEGRLMIYKMAETRAVEIDDNEADGKFKGRLKFEYERKKLKIERGFKKQEVKLLKIRDDAVKVFMAKKDRLGLKGKALVGWSYEQNEIAIDKIVSNLEDMVEDYNVEVLRDKFDEDMQTLVNEIEKKSQTISKIQQYIPSSILEFAHKFKRSHNEKIHELSVDLRRQYTERESYRARRKEKTSHKKMAKIMAAWSGLGLKDIFIDWKKWTKSRVKQRRRDVRLKNKTERFEYEQSMANLSFATWELEKWTKFWDEYNDLPYWTHSSTGESRYNEPFTEDYFPKDWVQPELPLCVINPHTRKAYSPRSLRIMEADTPSEASEGGSSDESDEEWKNDRAIGGGGGGEWGEDAINNMVSVYGKDGRSEELANIGRYGDDDGDGEMVVHEDPLKGLENERDEAEFYVIQKRKQQILIKQNLSKHKKGPDNDSDNSIALAIAADEALRAKKVHVPTEEEVMDMVGFDRSKVDLYSLKQMNRFARDAIKLNKEFGRSDNGGVGSMVGLNGEVYGSYESDFISDYLGKREEKRRGKERKRMERIERMETELRADEVPTGLGTVFSREGGPRGEQVKIGKGRRGRNK